MEPTNETPEPKPDEPEFEDLLKFLEEQIPDTAYEDAFNDEREDE